MRSLAQVVLTYLLNATWQVAVVVAFAMLAHWLLRAVPARFRYVLWVLTLVACVTLPMFGIVKSRQLSEARVPSDTRRAPGPVVLTRILTPGVEIADETNVEQILAAKVANRPLISGSSINLPARLASALFFLYAAFLVFKLLLLFRAWRRTQSIVRGALDTPLRKDLQLTVDRCARLVDVPRVRILHSAEVPVPITLGVVNPIIVLPERLLEETDRDLLSTAIGHEFVHIARRDYLWNLIFEALYLPLSFHPAAAVVRRRIRQMRELCCDEAVTKKLLNAETYAHSLMRLIGSAPLSPQLMSDTTIGLNQSDILEVRIMSLLSSKNRNHRSPRILLIAAALILIAPCLMGATLALRLDVYAQERTSSAQENEAKQQLEKLVELKQQARELNEKMKVADATNRQEIEARLREVQKTLEEHERAMAEGRDKQETSQRLRALLGEYERTKSPPDAETLKAMEKELASLESTYPRDEALVRETREKLTLLESAGQDRKAKLIYRVEPDYTSDAREKQIKGTVLLGLTVGHDGLPQSIQIKKSLFPSLDESAVNAVRKWRFEPAMKDGQPVSMYMLVEFYFAPDAQQTDLRGIEEREKTEANRDYAEESGDVITARRSKERQEEEQTERERRQSELTRDAVVPMDRAIQIATSQVPGKVLACSLGRDGVSIFYHVVIVAGEGNQTSATEVWVSATDGHIIKTEKEKEKRRAISGGALNGKALSLPDPEYPAIARAAHASGTVIVEVVVDEQGSIAGARAVSGHPLLQAAAVNAARQAKFTPTLLQGEPVRISGYLTYNFAAQ